MHYRSAVVWVFVFSCLAVAGSFYGQYGMGIDPCVLCIVQRVAAILAALIALLCALFPSKRFFSRLVQTLLIGTVAVVGLGVGITHLYIQSLPFIAQPSCGAPWTFRLRDAPLFQWYEPIIRGNGNCGDPVTAFGLDVPVWSVLFFLLVLLWIGFWWWRHRRS